MKWVCRLNRLYTVRNLFHADFIKTSKKIQQCYICIELHKILYLQQSEHTLADENEIYLSSKQRKYTINV